LKQWRHHLCAFVFILIAFGVSLFRGTNQELSPIGIERCGKYDNFMLGGFLVFAAIMVIY